MRLNSSALIAQLRRPIAGIKNMSRTRQLWLGGAVALIAIGLALAFFSPPPPTSQSVSTAINVELPPAGGAGAAAGGGSRATLLVPAPDPGLVEDSPNGPLPIIGK